MVLVVVRVCRALSVDVGSHWRKLCSACFLVVTLTFAPPSSVTASVELVCAVPGAVRSPLLGLVVLLLFPVVW